MFTLQATLLMGSWIALAGVQGAQPNITFTRIADTNTPIPGGAGNFVSLRVPAIDNNQVAFRGVQASGEDGVYARLGGILVAIADENTLVPGTAETLSVFSTLDISVDGSNVAFKSVNNTRTGFFIRSGGQLETVVDDLNPLPGMGSAVLPVFGPSMDSGDVAFAARGPASGDDGVFVRRGGDTFSVVANQGTTVPGKSVSFDSFGRPAISGGSIAFMGQDDNGFRGVYQDTVGGLQRVADTNTPIPGGTGTFQNFGQFLSNDTDQVAFWGSGSSSQVGIYKDVDGLKVVADRDTLIPDGSGSFSSFNNVSLANGQATFIASGDFGQRGIYAEFGDELIKVISIDDLLDGRVVDNLNFFIEGRSGDNVAFSVGFTDGFEAIYVANLPEPVTFTWLLAGAMAVLRRRRAS